MIGYYSKPSQMVRNIIFFNIGVFLIQKLSLNMLNHPIIEEIFSLHYLSVMYEYKIWQVFTYMFLHGGFWHLLFNMLALYFIGSEIERFWGPKPFLTFYLLTGLGAGLSIFAVDSLKVLINSDGINSLGFTVGASGAIFALILIYSILFKERQISLLLFFIFPVTIKAKNLLVVSLGLTILLPIFMGSGTRISHVGHIGGILSGIAFLFFFKNNRNYSFAFQSLIDWIKDIFKGFKTKTRPKIMRQHPNEFHHLDDLDETAMSEREIEDKIDALLDIIAIKGIKGLNPQEKNFLERVSLLYRHKFPN